MDLFELLSKRRTVRQFKTDPVPQADVEKIVQAGLLAPSPNDSHPWRIIAIRNQGILREMRAAVEKKLDALFPAPTGDKKTRLDKVKNFSTIFAQAPLVLAVMMKPYRAIVDDLLDGSALTHDQINALRKYPDVQATGALVQNMLLAATDLGYGAVWVSGALVASEDLDRLLKGGEYKVQTLVALGRPAVSPEPRRAYDLKEYLATID